MPASQMNLARIATSTGLPAASTGLLRLRRGVSLAELMISIVITAVLLTAAAAALDASFKAYAINQEESSLMQQARVTLHRITTMIRTCKTHAPETSTAEARFALGKIVTDTGISMFDDADNIITYHYDATNKQLLCVTSTASHVMLRGVEKFEITLEPMQSDKASNTTGAYDLLRRAIITLTIRTTDKTAHAGESTGDQVLTLSAAVAPRCNSW